MVYRCFWLKSERSILVNEVSLRRIACTMSSCMNMTVFSTVYLRIPYKPLSALISGSLAKLGSCTGTSGQYYFSATMFCLIKRLRLENIKFLLLNRKKSLKKGMVELAAVVHGLNFYYFLHF